MLTDKDFKRIDLIGNKIVATEYKKQNDSVTKEQVYGVIKIKNGVKGDSKLINDILRGAEKYGYNYQDVVDYFRKMYGDENVYTYIVSNRKYKLFAELERDSDTTSEIYGKESDRGNVSRRTDKTIQSSELNKK